MCVGAHTEGKGETAGERERRRGGEQRDTTHFQFTPQMLEQPGLGQVKFSNQQSNPTVLQHCLWSWVLLNSATWLYLKKNLRAQHCGAVGEAAPAMPPSHIKALA